MKKLLLLSILFVWIVELNAQNQQVLDEAVKLKNSLDAYMKQQVGNTPLTDKEKWMFQKMDSLQKLNAALQNSLKNCGQTKQEQRSVSTEPTLPFSIFFSSNSKVLDARSKIQIEVLFKQINNRNIRIQAFTDAYGSQAYNEKLAAARLEVICNYLKALGYTGSIEILPYTFDNSANGQKSSFSRRVDISF